MTASEQARADALADAATLEFYFACAGFPPSMLPGKAAAILRVYGRPSEWGGAPAWRGTIWRECPEWARMDAHAAFRAVPGLRGDR